MKTILCNDGQTTHFECISFSFFLVLGFVRLTKAGNGENLHLIFLLSGRTDFIIQLFAKIIIRPRRDSLF